MKLKHLNRSILAVAVMLVVSPGLNLGAAILDGGINPDNLGKGDWVYYMQYVTNHLGGNVPGVHDIPTFMAYEKSQGMNYIIVKAADGGIDFNGGYSSPQFNSNLVYQAHAAGLQIFGYTRSFGTNVPAEIAMAAKIYNLGADGFVLDAEAEWESSHLGANGPTLAIQLCSGIKAQFPAKFLGHAPLPIISYHTSFPYAQFGYYCDTVMPQDYWQDGGLGALVNYSPSNMVTRMDSEWRSWQQSLRGQWTNAIKPLAPLAQAWNPTATNITTGAQITQFLNALKGDPNPVTAGGYNGVSFWRADLHTADMWTGIGGNTIGKTNSAPSITTPPQDRIVVLGKSATFTVAATGYPLPGYQWQFNSNNIANATNTSYTVSNAQTNNQGSYQVIITNYFGAVTSSAATLTAISPPSIVTQPQGQTVATGADATFTVTATGGNLAYQWLFNNSTISGATNSSYTISNAQTNHAGNYSVVVTNIAGSVTSSNAPLFVSTIPLQFQSISLLSNGTVEMTLIGVTGDTCTVKVSNNLKDWGTLGTFSNTNGMIQFTDVVATNTTARLYRAQLEP